MARNPRSRLGQADWLQAALKLLVDKGISAVTIERLSRILGVTRGSFYHHFADRNELLTALLTYWKEEATVRVREEVSALKLDPKTTLLALSRAIRHRKAARYDVAFRAWAMHDEMAKKVVRETDELRLGFCREIFAAAGFADQDLENRARLFYYYELADPMIFAEQSDELEDALVEVRNRFLTQPDDED